MAGTHANRCECESCQRLTEPKAFVDVLRDVIERMKTDNGLLARDSNVDELLFQMEETLDEMQEQMDAAVAFYEPSRLSRSH